MQIYNLDATNTTTLSTNYSYDDDLLLKKNIFYTENNIFFNLENILKNPNDYAANNFSNLYLSDKKIIEDYAEIKPLQFLEDEGFSTYLAANSLYGVNNESRFWVAEEPTIDYNTASVKISGLETEIDNRFYFEIILLDGFKCKIAHENDGIKRYLTSDFSNNLSFAKYADLDYLGEYSPQIFLYVYDRNNDLIAFYKNINDIINYLSYDSINQELSYIPTLTGSTINFTNQTVFKCLPRQETSNVTPLDDPWVSYEKNSNNDINIYKNLSYENVQSNLMLNSEYLTITGDKLNSNILALKNTNTPENYQSRANPFFYEESSQMRDYKRLFSGSNQELGNDNITLGYEAFTSNIILKKDKITYFHIPQNFYPFTKLNINDSKLAEAGAIAGDHPIKSDKIFKKKADYKFTSYFGNSLMENTGSFLCSWLSGNNNFNTRPIWVDRYYFPSKISFVGALTSTNFNAVEYITQYDCLRGQVPQDINTVDKISDLIFEPGTYYAYHHIGSNFSKEYLNYLNNSLIQKDFDLYFNTNNAPIEPNLGTIYHYDGNEYSSTNSLTSIQNTNEFTLIFDMYSDNWNKPFGYQIFGNYTSDGFGVYNTNKITPALFISNLSSIVITNLNFETLDTVETPVSASAILRLEGFDDYYVITSNGYFNKYNNKNSLLYSTYNPAFANIYDYEYDEQFAFILCYLTGAPTAYLYRVDLNTGEILQIFNSSNIYSLYFLDFAVDSIDFARTVNFKNNNLYFTAGNKSERYLDNIYYRTTSGLSNTIYRWDIKYNLTTSSSYSVVVSSYSTLNDFDLDIDGNMWVLYDNYRFSKLEPISKTVQLSGSLPTSLSACNTTNIDFGYTIEDQGIQQYVYVSTLSSNNKSITIKLDNNGNALKSFTSPLPGANNTSLTQSSFLRYYFSDLYTGNVINIKFKLKNFVDTTEYESMNLIHSLSSLTPGYHNFVYRFNSNGGTFHLIIDGKIEIEYFFDPKKYKFSNLIERPFVFGTGVYTSNIPLFEYLNDNSFNCRGIKIKNLYFYDKALNYFDILMNNRIYQNVNDVIFDVPCGKRNHLEEIERYFKFRVPGSKSSTVNIVLKNSGINNSLLQNEIEKRIYSLLAKTAPAYIKVNDIKWSN